MRTEHQRFLDKVEITNSCWLWHGTTYRGGYGHFRRKINGKWVMYKAHRYAYEHYYKEDPGKFFVCHRCDNPSCVNPDHLFLGSVTENTQDKMQKGRHRFGVRPDGRKLSQQEADALRERWRVAKEGGMSQRAFAKTVGISAPQMSRVLNNKIWQSPEGV